MVLLTGCRPSKRYVIGVSQCSEDNWRDKLNSEMLTAALAYGDIDLRILSSHDNSGVQQQHIEQFINEGVDLLIVAPNQTKSIQGSLKKARDKGIPVICFDRKVDPQYYTAFIGADNHEVGRAVGELLARELDGHGRILEVQGLEDSSPAIDRDEGFRDAPKFRNRFGESSDRYQRCINVQPMIPMPGVDGFHSS